MQCSRPLTAFRHKNKKKEPIRFSPPLGEVSIWVKFHLPCGQCTFCRLEQSRQWAARIMMEAQLHEQNSFLTLTYSDDNLPEFNSLSRHDLTCFFKRLRKALSPKKIRYYAVGEYGDTTNRPHYHVILFGHDFSDDRKMYKNRRHPLYQSPLLDSAWGLGYANIGKVSFESAAYCARYCLKKVNAPLDEDLEVACDVATGEVFSMQREFSVMSRRPGIAANWWKRFGADTMRTDTIYMRGAKMKPPRYFDKLFEKWLPIDYEDMKQKRVLRDPVLYETMEQYTSLAQAERARVLLQKSASVRRL